MTRINVISINPNQLTLGALHPENIIRRRRDRIRESANESVTHISSNDNVSGNRVGMKGKLNLFFGINSETGVKTSLKLFICRVLFSAFLISWCLISLGTAQMEVISTFLVVGVLLLAGLFARVATGCGFIASTAFVINEIFVSGTLNESMSLLALGCLIFCMLGPGKLSFDSLIRDRLFRISKLVALRKVRKMAEIRLSYKAMSYDC